MRGRDFLLVLSDTTVRTPQDAEEVGEDMESNEVKEPNQWRGGDTSEPNQEAKYGGGGGWQGGGGGWHGGGGGWHGGGGGGRRYWGPHC